MTKDSKIYIAGHNGMVGSAVWEMLHNLGFQNLIGFSSRDLDLTDQISVKDFFEDTRPDYVVNAAARVGGILANNNYPYQFLMDNMLIQNNLIDSALKSDVQKFIFLGSSCIYPKYADQPIREESLLTSSLEPTNEWYAIAKISGVKSCEAIRKQYNKDFISLMPTNLYGPRDNFDLETSHVLPAMIRKFHEAKKFEHNSVTLWGTGTPRREFLHVKDMAKAVVFALQNSFPDNLYNVGTGFDLSISELASLVKSIVGYKGETKWDTSKPDGTPRKLMDVNKINNLGWKAQISLNDGIEQTYKWFKANTEEIKQNKIND